MARTKYGVTSRAKHNEVLKSVGGLVERILTLETLTVYTLSECVPSTARPPLQIILV